MSTGAEPSSRGPAYPFSAIRERMATHAGPVLDFALGRFNEPPPDWLTPFVREHAERVVRRAERDEDVQGQGSRRAGRHHRVGR